MANKRKVLQHNSACHFQNTSNTFKRDIGPVFGNLCHIRVTRWRSGQKRMLCDTWLFKMKGCCICTRSRYTADNFNERINIVSIYILNNTYQEDSQWEDHAKRYELPQELYSKCLSLPGPSWHSLSLVGGRHTMYVVPFRIRCFETRHNASWKG